MNLQKLQLEEIQPIAELEGLSVPAVLEKYAILAALVKTDFCYAHAAKELRMPRSTFYDRCGRYKLRHNHGECYDDAMKSETWGTGE